MPIILYRRLDLNHRIAQMKRHVFLQDAENFIALFSHRHLKLVTGFLLDHSQVGFTGILLPTHARGFYNVPPLLQFIPSKLVPGWPVATPTSRPRSCLGSASA